MWAITSIVTVGYIVVVLRKLEYSRKAAPTANLHSFLPTPNNHADQWNSLLELLLRPQLVAVTAFLLPAVSSPRW